MKQELTAERLRELLDYDPDTGVFVKAGTGEPVGRRHGSRILVSVDGKRYDATRLAWLHYFGFWPPGRVMPRNRDRSDVRATNLRIAGPSLALTADRLREVLSYDKESGQFTRLVCGDDSLVGPTGEVNHHGYERIAVDGNTYQAHRLAWLHVTGTWPALYIDHIDGNRSNNRWANLREASREVNNQNQRRAHKDNKTGFLGVYFHKASGLFASRICVDRKSIMVGYFHTPEEAHAAYLKAKRELHEGCTI